MIISENTFETLRVIKYHIKSMTDSDMRRNLTSIIEEIKKENEKQVKNKRCNNELCIRNINYNKGCSDYRDPKNCEIYNKLNPIKKQWVITVPEGVDFRVSYELRTYKSREVELDNLLQYCGNEAEITHAKELGITCKLVEVDENNDN